MKTKILIFFLLCFASLNMMGFTDDPPQKKGKVQGTITRNSTRKTEPKKQKTEQPTKQNHGKKQSGNNQRQNSKPRSGTLNGHDWVDLGLSVKWATCNVGASSPSDYGGYYAWGETSTKSRYDWDNYFDCLDGTGGSFQIYKKGSQTRIKPSSGHDTARENWGSTWRMPTYAECNELCKKCKWTWASKEGHNGYNVKGPNGNSIFLPVAGGYSEPGISQNAGDGLYWSCMLNLPYSYEVHVLGFDSKRPGRMRHFNREVGLSVRPVTE